MAELKEYETPEITITSFNPPDIITTSGDGFELEEDKLGFQ